MTLYILFGLGIPSDAQGLLLSLHSGITPGSAQEMLGNLTQVYLVQVKFPAPLTISLALFFTIFSPLNLLLLGPER